MEISDKISLIAIGVSLISALIAIRSNYIAKKSLKITTTEHESRKPNFETYLKYAFRLTINNNNEDKKLILTNITIYNKSDFSNTLSASLRIKYRREDNSSSSVILEHKPQLSELLENNKYEFFSTNIELNARGSLLKWLIFSYPSFLTCNHRIDEYSIELTDNFQNKSISKVLIMENMI